MRMRIAPLEIAVRAATTTTNKKKKNRKRANDFIEKPEERRTKVFDTKKASGHLRHFFSSMTEIFGSGAIYIKHIKAHFIGTSFSVYTANRMNFSKNKLVHANFSRKFYLIWLKRATFACLWLAFSLNDKNRRQTVLKSNLHHEPLALTANLSPVFAPPCPPPLLRGADSKPSTFRRNHRLSFHKLYFWIRDSRSTMATKHYFLLSLNYFLIKKTYIIGRYMTCEIPTHTWHTMAFF